jgi:hypothetical protein
MIESFSFSFSSRPNYFKIPPISHATSDNALMSFNSFQKLFLRLRLVGPYTDVNNQINSEFFCFIKTVIENVKIYN